VARVRGAAVIGYAVHPNPDLASFRLRVALPARHTGHKYIIGSPGDLTFFYKFGNPDLARECECVVYDVVNDHFDRADVREMADIADELTCASPFMAHHILRTTGRAATVIPDPYENAEAKPEVIGTNVLWFGHSANLPSLRPYLDAVDTVCTSAPGAVPWSLDNERICLEDCAVVLMTGSNPGASENRVVKAIRAGRFVVAPTDCPASWRDLPIWIGDVRNGIAWAFNNREEACSKIKAGQDYVRERFSPEAVGKQWGRLFDLTLAAETSARRAG
jgi:hypothetical protein